MIGATLTYISGAVMLTSIVSEEMKNFTSFIIVAPPATAFAIFSTTKTYEPFLDWWHSRPIKLHQRIISGLAAFISITMVGLVSSHFSTNGKSR